MRVDNSAKFKTAVHKWMIVYMQVMQAFKIKSRKSMETRNGHYHMKILHSSSCLCDLRILLFALILITIK